MRNGKKKCWKTRIGAPHWCVSPEMMRATFPLYMPEEARQAIINSKAMAWLLKREFDAMTELRFDDEGVRMAA